MPPSRPTDAGAPRRRRALFSVSDKTGLADFARGLADLGWELISTGGTARALRAEGLTVLEVEEVTDFPEMLEGRVKTLHPKIHGGILARRNRADDMAALERFGIQPIDLLAVNLYPFRETASRPNIGWDELVEQIDIGGPSLLRAAAKNYRDVMALVDVNDYSSVLAELKSRGNLDEAARYRLMQKVFAHTASYDSAIAEYLAAHPGPAQPATSERLPGTIHLDLSRRAELRYGENPHQIAGWYTPSGSGQWPWLASADLLQGKELSYNNLLDLHAAASCLCEFEAIAAVIVKHNTPCGVATSTNSLVDAYRKARAADETSAFGGIVAINGLVDDVMAEALAETFLEAVVAPRYTSGARERLSAKKNLRLLQLPFLDKQEFQSIPGSLPLEFRSVGDSFLVQEADLSRDDPGQFEVTTRRQPTAEEREALLFGWAVVKHVRSNAIVFAARDRTLAIGGGQTSRVEAVELAARKGGASLQGSAVASDAFFPFRDGLDAAVRAGARAIIQPGGSVRDAEVIAAANEQDVAMIFTHRRHFRH